MKAGRSTEASRRRCVWPGGVALLVAVLLMPAAAAANLVNLARFQATSASSNAEGAEPWRATDGIARPDSAWMPAPGAGPHWLEVRFPFPVTVGAAQIHSGNNGRTPLRAFHLEALETGGWRVVAGSAVTDNLEVQRTVVFAEPVRAMRFRLVADGPGAVVVREWALLPPAAPEAYVPGIGVQVNLAWEADVDASSMEPGGFANRAVDGFLRGESEWVSADDPQDDWLEVRLPDRFWIGSAVVYTGWGDSPPDAAFRLQYDANDTWADIPGATVTNNHRTVVPLNFDRFVVTSRVRYVAPGGGRKHLSELVLLMENGGRAPAPGEGVDPSVRPEWKFTDFDDHYHRLVVPPAPPRVLRSLPSRRLTAAGWNDHDESVQYQVLWNIGTDTFRFRNRATGASLTVLDDAPGSEVIELPYTGLAHQNWRLVPVGGNWRILNAFSGLALELGVDETTGEPRLTQRPASASSAQRWGLFKETHFPKKGIAGWLNLATLFQPAWGYNWNGDDGTLPNGGWQFPVQQNAWWPGWNRIPWKYVFYNSRVRPDHHFAFNEPDHTDQANMTVAQAVALWPRLERLHVPLASPAPATYGSWIRDFMRQAADERGYRVDYMAVHWYGSPAGGSPDWFIDWLRSIHDTYRRPLILNEFSTVDWGGNAHWTEEDNYNFFAEFFWRAEDLDWLNKYSPFLFHGGVPENPWDQTAPRGNWMNGDRPTAIGELFAAWDGDRTIRGFTPYFLHSQATRKRLKNGGGYRLQPGTIRESGADTQFVLVPAGDEAWHIVSLADGARLWSNGSVLRLVPAGAVGAEVTWEIRPAGNGWHYIQLAHVGWRLRCADVLDDGTTDPVGVRFGLAKPDTASAETRFFLVKPWQPVPVEPPAPPPFLTAERDGPFVRLTWGESPSADRWAYLLRRRIEPDGEWLPLLSRTRETSFVDDLIFTGQTYTYEVRTIDWTGLESAPRRTAIEIPLPPVRNYAWWAGEVFGPEPGPEADPAADPDGDGRPNLWEYVLITDPLAPEPAPFGLFVDEVGRLLLRVRFREGMPDYRVIYEFSPRLGPEADWQSFRPLLTVAGEGEGEHVVRPPDFGTGAGFFRLRLEPLQTP